MKKVFLTFGDGADNFIAARERIAREARDCGVFDEVLAYSLKDASDEARNSPLKDYRRGCGYWMWKPDIVDSVLARLDDGDILVWSDSGNVVRKSTQWRAWLRDLQKFDLIFHRISSCAFHFNRREAMDLFAPNESGIPPMTRMCFHFESGTIFMRKTSLSVALMAEWKETMHMHPECVVDVLSQEEMRRQLPSFRENRHDQTILSLIVYKYLAREDARDHIKSVWEFHRGYNIFSDPCLIVARNRSGAAYRVSMKTRFARAAYRVLWWLQEHLERKGLLICWAKIGSEVLR